MICPECRNKIPEGSKFCLECGRKIDFTCSACGRIVLPESKFCLECGLYPRRTVLPTTLRLIRSKATASKSVMGGERFLQIMIGL